MAILIVGATLIDGAGGAPASGSFVLVEGDRIREVGRGAPPKGEGPVVDLEGRALLPGLAADLLVVDGDPSRDVLALERTFGVMQAGRWVRLGSRTV